jgi:hypothetical protein
MDGLATNTAKPFRTAGLLSRRASLLELLLYATLHYGRVSLVGVALIRSIMGRSRLDFVIEAWPRGCSVPDACSSPRPGLTDVALGLGLPTHPWRLSDWPGQPWSQ